MLRGGDFVTTTRQTYTIIKDCPKPRAHTRVKINEAPRRFQAPPMFVFIEDCRACGSYRGEQFGKGLVNCNYEEKGAV